jgi:hypothetical protein
VHRLLLGCEKRKAFPESKARFLPNIQSCEKSSGIAYGQMTFCDDKMRMPQKNAGLGLGMIENFARG